VFCHYERCLVCFRVVEILRYHRAQLPDARSPSKFVRDKSLVTTMSVSYAASAAAAAAPVTKPAQDELRSGRV